MLEVMYRLLEMMALVLCLHSISEEKVKLDIYNAGFIAVELTFMQMIQDAIVSEQMYFAVYLIYFIYAYVKFDDAFKVAILKCTVAILITGGLQMAVYLPVFIISPLIENEIIVALIINTIVLFILFLTRNTRIYSKIIKLCINKDWIITTSLLLCITIVMYYVISLKKSSVIEIDIFILISIFGLIFGIFVYRWQRVKYELEIKESEMQITNLYNGMFKELIENIRNKQHDFNNQIDAIYSSHITANTLEELKEIQKEHCSNLEYDNRFSKLLGKINNSTLSGFIYTKFLKAEQNGIKIKYDAVYTGNTKISIFDLVEIIGIFMDNAIEAVSAGDVPKEIVFELSDSKGLELCVKNPINNISHNDVEKFFERGYSTKNRNSGLGLSKVKEMQKKYQYDILTRIDDINERKWLEFKIIEKT